MALALYRKYRPRTFAEVIGQDHVTEPLTQALRTGRLHHAYLFSGPRGCGKTSSARILARSLNCVKGPTPEPCGTCDSCRSMAGDGTGSIDVIEIDAASHGGVDDARELRERAFFAPASSRFKIYVIDEAHMVSSAGFNALLKLVEEPPDYVKFIFATTEPEKVLGTIKSRTHHYPFRLIPPGVLRPYLEQLAVAEGVKVEPAVFPLVVRAGGGSVRDALSLLDQLIAGAGPDGVSYARALALLGVTDGALIDEMCDALAAADGAAAYATVDRVAEAGHDPRRFASDLLERLRDLIVLQQVPDAAAKGLIDGPADQVERMVAQAQRLGPATLSRCADIVHNGLIEMRGTTAPRLLLELITARMLLPAVDDGTGALLQRLERMERRLTLSGGGAPSVAAGSAPVSDPPAVRPTPAPAPSDPPATPPSGRERADVERPAGADVDRRPRADAERRPRADAERPPRADAERPPRADAERPPRADAERPPRARARDHAPTRDRPAAQADAASARRQDTAEPPTAQQPGGRQVSADAVMPDPAAPDPTVPGAASPGELDAAAVRRVWDEILGMVARKSKRAAAVAREATVRDVDGPTLVLTFRHSVHANMLAASPDLLLEAIYEVLGGRWEIRCEVAGDQSGPPGGTAGTASPTPSTAVARPAAGAAARTAESPAGPPSDDGDWPEPARPGGVAPGAVAAPAAEVASSTAPGGSARRASRTADSAAPASNGAGGSGPAVTPGAAAGRAPRPAGKTDAGNGAGVGEPPYDPEFDGPPRPVSYEGFDPGDEPLDGVVDEQTARQTSEEQAVQLLQETLGAEKIGEVDAR